MRRILRAAVVAFLVAVPVSSARAAGVVLEQPAVTLEQPVTLEQQGWWSEAQQLPAPVPLNTATGTKLVVGNDASGPNAIAAVRFLVDGTVPATLTLKIADGAQPPPVLVACPIHSVWRPATGGAWADRPKSSCLLSAAGVTTGTTVSFALGPPLQSAEGVYDLALVPQAGEVTPFVVQFAPASAASLRAAPAAPPSSDDEPPVAPPEFTANDLVPFLPFDYALPPDIAPVAPATTPVPAASRTRPLPATSPPRALATQRGQRAIALATLLLMALVVWWFGGGPVRLPRHLVSRGRENEVDGDDVAFVRTGGIGRFARPRDRLPPRL